MNRQMIKGRDATTELQLINTLGGGGDSVVPLIYCSREEGQARQ